jgi:hypothetical protein
MPKQSSTQFNCFSPPVMIATVVIELALLLYTVWRYKMDILTKLVALCVFALAVFQISEYNVCAGNGVTAGDWSRLGYAAITTLPPLGLHILHVLAAKPKRRLVGASYLTMVGFIAYFLTYPAVFTGFACTGNYVIFQIGVRSALTYGAYYYGWLFTALYLGFRWAHQLVKPGPPVANRLKTIQALIVGYLVFLVPTALAYSVSPVSRRGIPSIMCGFAILFALILTLYVLPLAASKRVMLAEREPITP